MTKTRPHTNDSFDQASEIQSWFALGSTDFSDRPAYMDELGAWLPSDGFGNFTFPIAAGERDGGNGVSGLATQPSPGQVASPDASGAGEGSPATSSSPPRAAIGSQGQAGVEENPAAASGPAVTIASGASVEIDGPSAQSVTFAGTTGTLKLQDAVLFTGLVAGLSGADAIDLSGFAYGADVKATFLGNTTGGTLTVADGAKTARIALSGNYLSSTWTLSNDGKGGTTVVDPTTSTNWQTLKVGGGGYATGLDVNRDGSMVARTDGNGAYLWNGTSWVQLVTATSLPAAFVAANPVASGAGVYEIQMAPSNSSIMYMMYDGYVFKSANKGTTWTQTSFGQVAADLNAATRQYGQKIAIDPNNPNIVYVGTPQNGLWVTTNGGTSWSQVGEIPTSQKYSDGSYPGITGILFDPAIGGQIGGVTQTIFASSYGNGVYESSNGGSTWTRLTGGPTDADYAAVSSTGVYYAVGNSNSSLWSYANGKWTQLLTASGMAGVAVNPSNANEVVVQYNSGNLSISYDGGATWSGYTNTTLTSTDIPWLAAGNTALAGYVYTTAGGLAFSPTASNQLISSAGTGVWTTTGMPTSITPGVSPTVGWSDMTAGIENLDANAIIVPTSGHPVLASWDRPFFYISNPNAYPSTYGPVNSTSLNAGWSIDYASSDPSFVVGIADWYYSGTEQSGYSTNGGQTWTNFASYPTGAGSAFMGGTIAASTPQNIVWAPSGGHQPYYTTNGGASWSPVTLPSVSSWSNFDWAYYLDQRSVTADRVLANTFYLYYPGQGVFSTTNGGSSWTKVYSGTIGPDDNYNSTLMSVPGEASNLFYTGGPVGTPGATPANEPFYRSTNGGATWTAVPNVLEVFCFGFGAAAPGQSYPAIYIVGYVNNVYGIWQSTNNAQSWTNIGTYPLGELSQIKTISGDPNHFGEVYVGMVGGSYAYLPAASGAAPTVTGATDLPATGDLNAGKTVSLTLSFSETVTVAGGTPTLTLNDGGTATYASGSGTNALTFTYTVAAGQNAASLAATVVNLPNGVAITDGAGNAANLSLSGLSQSGPQIDTTTPAVTSVAASPASGTELPGNSITFTIRMSEAVTIAGGTPTLTLNDGGTAKYTGGSGTNALTFAYTVAPSDRSVSSLAITAVNVPTGVTIRDGAGNAANMAGVLATFNGLSVDPPATVAYYLANQAVLDAAGNITIGDSAADVSGSIDALNGDGHVTAITLTDTGTPTLSLTAAQALSDTHAVGAITNSSYAIAVADTAADVVANLNALNADAHVTSVTLTDAGQPTLTLTLAQALNDATALTEIRSPYTTAISDTATNIQSLTSAQVATLHQMHVSQITATNASVGMSAAQAVALENQSISVSVPTGSLLTVSDTAADLQAMTTAQIFGLDMIGAYGLSSTDSNVTFNAAQTSAIQNAKLTLSAAGTYSVTEKFTSGAVISSSNQGSSGGALTLSSNANGLTVNVGASVLSVTAGAETIPLNPHPIELINATNRNADTFVFAPDFGNDTIQGFAATGANHDTIQLEVSMFSYLTPGMTQAQDLAAVLGHATSSGGTTTISDTLGDALALTSTSVSTLQANPAAFKFV